MLSAADRAPTLSEGTADDAGARCLRHLEVLDRGHALYAKRLDRGKFIWPSASDGAVSIGFNVAVLSQDRTPAARRPSAISSRVL